MAIKQIITGIMPTNNVINPLDRASFTFCVADIATSKGVALVEEVKDGGGLLEPVDRAVERAAEAQQAFERALFYSKRLPLFINWQVEALLYDVLIMPETQQVLGDVNRINAVIADAPEAATNTRVRWVLPDPALAPTQAASSPGSGRTAPPSMIHEAGVSRVCMVIASVATPTVLANVVVI